MRTESRMEINRGPGTGDGIRTGKPCQQIFTKCETITLGTFPPVLWSVRLAKAVRKVGWVVRRSLGILKAVRPAWESQSAWDNLVSLKPRDATFKEGW